MKKNTLFAILLVFVIALVIILTSAFSFQYSLPFFGGVVVQQAATTCNESDGGVLFYIKGTISLCTGVNCIVEGEDVCKDTSTITEYYCSGKNEIKTVGLKCPFGCDDGACLQIGQKPKPKPEEKPMEEEKPAEEEIKEIVCDGKWICADKIKLYQNVDCSWIKEEYCRFGCIEGECKNPTFWEKFLFWLQGQTK